MLAYILPMKPQVYRRLFGLTGRLSRLEVVGCELAGPYGEQCVVHLASFWMY